MPPHQPPPYFSPRRTPHNIPYTILTINSASGLIVAITQTYTKAKVLSSSWLFHFHASSYITLYPCVLHPPPPNLLSPLSPFLHGSPICAPPAMVHPTVCDPDRMRLKRREDTSKASADHRDWAWSAAAVGEGEEIEMDSAGRGGRGFRKGKVEGAPNKSELLKKPMNTGDVRKCYHVKRLMTIILSVGGGGGLATPHPREEIPY